MHVNTKRIEHEDPKLIMKTCNADYVPYTDENEEEKKLITSYADKPQAFKQSREQFYFHVYW